MSSTLMPAVAATLGRNARSAGLALAGRAVALNVLRPPALAPRPPQRIGYGDDVALGLHIQPTRVAVLYHQHILQHLDVHTFLLWQLLQADQLPITQNQRTDSPRTAHKTIE